MDRSRQRLLLAQSGRPDRRVLARSSHANGSDAKAQPRYGVYRSTDSAILLKSVKAGFWARRALTA